ncbi:tRNA (adenosine(37)-N6)-threonylcarbamoyltransferase complex dimerization subunit type 1 TsaB [Psychrobacter sp.]|uniref:tRNA (adenosine(37)-N6)-threonylcarbamoyltransferase complex dimerization subunit type 1 TsaB n=1 Tax=Psychrobacter sp. TaxID=56811 RepID=UPI002649DD1D|nr:tRNA (adenosine(37)-N6)-threonylcarbamoyltransferase complex dimerization subunit type 1 TsaB [Psychrobacter sp.]MDN6276698.1 tRNA (adenosine(37)-N6)-threonylcarbamoyltransferase complex dimerization subunit type 1 TsaB [Psychrobacter sp.]MDN6307138.1 tRNA (adenosine(37)-N6)-threonylcarbamoyltransferase complex dimerization subunit type 1 TsaB [Psychrobacter sp.]
MFLAMDTVFDQCSIAILDGSGQVLSSQTETGKRQQTQQVLPMIDAALSEAQISFADIQAFVFNRGPGAFSGIRINTAVVQALSFAHDIPCVGISSLQAIAQCAHQKYGLTEVYSALDARMQQVYFGQYELKNDEQAGRAVMQPVLSNDSDSTEQLLDYDSQTALNLAVVGNGAPLLALDGQQVCHEDVHPDAVVIGLLGIVQFSTSGGTDAANALPRYLRNQAWKTLKEQGKA